MQQQTHTIREPGLFLRPLVCIKNTRLSPSLISPKRYWSRPLGNQGPLSVSTPHSRKQVRTVNSSRWKLYIAGLEISYDWLSVSSGRKEINRRTSDEFRMQRHETALNTPWCNVVDSILPYLTIYLSRGLTFPGPCAVSVPRDRPCISPSGLGCLCMTRTNSTQRRGVLSTHISHLHSSSLTTLRPLSRINPPLPSIKGPFLTRLAMMATKPNDILMGEHVVYRGSGRNDESSLLDYTKNLVLSHLPMALIWKHASIRTLIYRM